MIGLYVRSPKSESEALRRFYSYLYEKENAETELVELYELIDQEYKSLNDDMESVEEQVEEVRSERDEVKQQLDDMKHDLVELMKRFKKTKRKDIMAEIERILM